MRLLYTFVLFFSTLIQAATLELNTPLQSLNDYAYQTPHGRNMKVPNNTKLVIMAFEKDTGALVNDYLNTQSPFYLPKNHAVFIADIHRMPSIITKMFALPKMQKYKHPLYLHYEEQFENFAPHQEEKVTIIRFKDGKASSIDYITTVQELKAAIEQ